MNIRQILLAIVLFDFTALTAWAVWQHGTIGFFDLVTANGATITVFVDLCIALGLVLVWMWQDARNRDAAFFPYAFLTLTLGSVGPLLYLIVRSGSPVPAARLATEPR